MLVNSTGGEGASKLPWVNAAAICHADNVATTDPHRPTIAAAAASTAATASANGDPAGPAGAVSERTRTANPVNTMRIGSAREANRRSQPRTVPAGRPNAAAIHRCPRPAALASRPALITAATSARPDSATAGSSTCLPAQPPQRARRGRSRTRLRTARSQRTRPKPHGDNTPLQSGQTNPPDRSLASTLSTSASTVSNWRTSRAPLTALPDAPPREDRKGRASSPDPLTLSSRTKKGKPPSCPQDPAHPR